MLFLFPWFTASTICWPKSLVCSHPRTLMLVIPPCYRYSSEHFCIRSFISAFDSLWIEVWIAFPIWYQMQNWSSIYKAKLPARITEIGKDRGTKKENIMKSLLLVVIALPHPQHHYICLLPYEPVPNSIHQIWLPVNSSTHGLGRKVVWLPTPNEAIKVWVLPLPELPSIQVPMISSCPQGRGLPSLLIIFFSRASEIRGEAGGREDRSEPVSIYI